MSTTDAAEKSIVVLAVQRRRYTDTNGQTVRRTIRLNGRIQSSDLEVMKGGDQVVLWIDEETPQTQVAIGFITADEEHREKLAPEIQLRLPDAAFTDFWNATNSTVTLKHDWSVCGRLGACSVRNCEGDLGVLAGTVTRRTVNRKPKRRRPCRNVERRSSLC
jgi:hypothetical protein